MHWYVVTCMRRQRASFSPSWASASCSFSSRSILPAPSKQTNARQRRTKHIDSLDATRPLFDCYAEEKKITPHHTTPIPPPRFCHSCIDNPQDRSAIAIPHQTISYIPVLSVLLESWCRLSFLSSNTGIGQCKPTAVPRVVVQSVLLIFIAARLPHLLLLTPRTDGDFRKRFWWIKPHLLCMVNKSDHKNKK